MIAPRGDTAIGTTTERAQQRLEPRGVRAVRHEHDISDGVVIAVGPERAAAVIAALCEGVGEYSQWLHVAASTEREEDGPPAPCVVLHC